MILSYNYKGQDYLLNERWTENDNSVIFHNIIKAVETRHNLCLEPYYGLAVRLDTSMDRLYIQLYGLPEHHSNTYNPAYPRLLEDIMNEIELDICSLLARGDGRLLYSLYLTIFQQICDIVEVFLADNRYQNKILKRHERSMEATPDEYHSTDFEDLVLQMTDLSNLMDCLTEKQRNRFVLHVFLKYTLQEIASKEGVGVSKIHKSVMDAYKKIHKRYSQM